MRSELHFWPGTWNLANSICIIMHIVIKQLLLEELGNLRFHGCCIFSLLALFAAVPFDFWYHGAKGRCNFKRFIGSYFLKFIPKSIFKSALGTEHSACIKGVIFDGACYCQKVHFHFCMWPTSSMVTPWIHQWFHTYFAAVKYITKIFVKIM